MPPHRYLPIKEGRSILHLRAENYSVFHISIYMLGGVMIPSMPMALRVEEANRSA